MQYVVCMRGGCASHFCLGEALGLGNEGWRWRTDIPERDLRFLVAAAG